MSQFLTVQEAATASGRSTSSIRRRLIYPIIKDDHHPDRQHIQPSVKEATQLRLKGENFPWKISAELLRRLMPANEPAEKGSNALPHKSSADGASELIVMLRRELDIKNQQITQQSELLSHQMDLISELNERLHEGNVLIATLQQHIALPEGGTRVTTSFVDAQSTKDGAGESPAKMQSRPKAKKQKPRRRIFGIF